jgi:hypothetical protein
MAITYQSGSVYADAAGQLITGRVKVAYLVFCPANGADQLTLRDGTSGSDPIKLNIHGEAAHRIVFLDFSNKPLVFNDGIYLSALGASSYLTLVITNEGKS